MLQPPWSYAYTAAWGLATLAAVALMVRRRSEIALFDRAYGHFLTQPWKLGLFAVAWAVSVLIAPYTGDPTWDYVDATFMCVLTYVTAPWALRLLWLALRHPSPRRPPAWRIYVAACAWLFSASWSYDGYLLLRDGVYPPTWLANLAASSFLYAAAGVLWSLDVGPSGAPRLAFAHDPWPVRTPPSSARRLAPYALCVIAPVAASFLYFLVD